MANMKINRTIEPMIETLRDYCKSSPDDVFNFETYLAKVNAQGEIYYKIFH